MAKEKNLRRKELLRKYTVKIIESGLSFSLFSYFHFFLIYLYFLFLELKVRISDNINKSHNTWKKVEGSRRSDIIQHVHHMLTSCLTHGILG